MAVPVTAASADDVAAVRVAEQALYSAQVAGAVDAIAPMLHDDLVYIHSTGVAEDKRTYLEGVANRLYEYGRIESRETRVDVQGDVAFMHGIVDMTVAAHGAPKHMIHLLFCLRWKRSADRWKLTYRQATRLAGE